MQTIVATGCKVSLKKKPLTSNSAIQLEWDIYKALPKTTKHDGRNMIQQLWQKHEAHLPLLAECGPRWLYVPASSSSSERIFLAGETFFHSGGPSFNQKMLTNCSICIKTMTRSTFNYGKLCQVTKETNQYLLLMIVVLLNLIWPHTHLKHLTLKRCLVDPSFLQLKCILF